MPHKRSNPNDVLINNNDSLTLVVYQPDKKALVIYDDAKENSEDKRQSRIKEILSTLNQSDCDLAKLAPQPLKNTEKKKVLTLFPPLDQSLTYLKSLDRKGESRNDKAKLFNLEVSYDSQHDELKPLIIIVHNAVDIAITALKKSPLALINKDIAQEIVNQIEFEKEQKFTVKKL